MKNKHTQFLLESKVVKINILIQLSFSTWILADSPINYTWNLLKQEI